MKSIQWKSFTLGIAFTLLLTVGFGSALAAGPITKNISAVYNNIKIVIDGKPVTLKDVSGNKIEPFIYNGTTYLPVRGVSEALGERVQWDGNTQTVYVGDRPGEVKYLTEVNPPYSGTADVYYLNETSSISMGGKKYNTGISLYHTHSLINLNSLYSEISFDLGTAKNRTLNSSYLNVYLDGELYESYLVNAQDLPREITIPLKGVNQLRFEYSGRHDYLHIGIGNPILK